MIEDFLHKLNTLIPNDKLLHSFYGNFIYAVTFLMFVIINVFIYMGIMTIALTAFTITFLIASGKEIYDKCNIDKHTLDYMDIVYTTYVPAIITLSVVIYTIIG